jgi:hypothetical protein
MMLPEIERLIRSFLIPKRCDGHYALCLQCIKIAYEQTHQFPTSVTVERIIWRAQNHAIRKRRTLLSTLCREDGRTSWEISKYLPFMPLEFEGRAFIKAWDAKFEFVPLRKRYPRKRKFGYVMIPFTYKNSVMKCWRSTFLPV